MQQCSRKLRGVHVFIRGGKNTLNFSKYSRQQSYRTWKAFRIHSRFIPEPPYHHSYFSWWMSSLVCHLPVASARVGQWGCTSPPRRRPKPQLLCRCRQEKLTASGGSKRMGHEPSLAWVVAHGCFLKKMRFSISKTHCATPRKQSRFFSAFHGSAQTSRVGQTQPAQISRCLDPTRPHPTRPDQTRSDPTRPARFNLTREKPLYNTLSTRLLGQQQVGNYEKRCCSRGTMARLRGRSMGIVSNNRVRGQWPQWPIVRPICFRRCRLYR